MIPLESKNKLDQGGRSDENARNHPHSPRARGERCARAAAPAPLRGKKLDQRAVLQVVRKVDWKKAGLIAGGVTVVCAAAGTASRYKFYQGIVARELKKQLAPLNDKLDALQAENRMLRAELEKKNAPTEEQN